MKKTWILISLLWAACQQKPQEPEQKTAPALEQNTADKANSNTAINLALDNDPVCMMSVKEEYTDTTLYDGKIYAFCGSGCKEDFIKEPLAYLNKK